MKEFTEDDEAKFLDELQELTELEFEEAIASATKLRDHACISIPRANSLARDPLQLTEEERRHIEGCSACQKLMGKFKSAHVIQFPGTRRSETAAPPPDLRIYLETGTPSAAEAGKALKDLAPESFELQVFDSPEHLHSSRLEVTLAAGEPEVLVVRHLSGAPMFSKLTGENLDIGRILRIETDSELTVSDALELALAFDKLGTEETVPVWGRLLRFHGKNEGQQRLKAAAHARIEPGWPRTAEFEIEGDPVHVRVIFSLTARHVAARLADAGESRMVYLAAANPPIEDLPLTHQQQILAREDQFGVTSRSGESEIERALTEADLRVTIR